MPGAKTAPGIPDISRIWLSLTGPLWRPNAPPSRRQDSNGKVE
jgi:hypothetical protein